MINSSPPKTYPLQQTENLLPEAICDLYHSLLGHYPDLVVCRFLTNSELALVFENFMTPIEKMLVSNGCEPLAIKVRQSIDLTFHRQLKPIVERYTARSIVDILAESKIGTGRKSVIFVLDSAQASS